MAIHDLPDMYALSPRACGPHALGIHIRQIPHGHVTTIKCTTLRGRIKGKSRDTFEMYPGKVMLMIGG